MEAPKALKNLQEVFREYFESNVVQILEKFISEGDLNWSIKDEKEKIFNELGEQILSEVSSQRPVVLSEFLWEDIKSTDSTFVTKIKEKALDQGKTPVEILSSISEVNKVDFDFLNYFDVFKIENQNFISDVDYILNFFYVSRSVPKFISSLNGSVDKLFIYRSLALEEPVEFIKKLMGGTDDKGPGLSWSRVGSKAQSYEGSKQDYHLKLHGTIPVESIDLEMTIVKNVSGYRSEAEYYLKEKEAIEIFRIEIFNSKMELVKTYDLDEPIVHRS